MLKARHQPKKWFWKLALLLGMLSLSYKVIKNYFQEPDAILVLGGSVVREQFAADFARKHSHLDVWISGGSNPEYAQWLFMEAGISLERLHLDYEAVDTVTNFTTLVDEFKARGIDSVYLITSDDHMRRAQVIGQIVFGSRGIEYKPLSVPSGREPEPMEKVVRDGARSVLWAITGKTGSSWKEWINKN
ncbi:YdcF family protein [Roseofilum sp. BLCC_M154]|uniref:YdcF family protein n=1 Tax=Roseofilum acuticapitatum BLCC-M154 TaxID=3022444 RepID=A0ABT7AU34_9CYAN|nr:YdcF family protein [Roseofilum acuticapitatum]MDJ1170416.1 YdcF family protein [Roseofilum acuticapitatum BLCC-M154]